MWWHSLQYQYITCNSSCLGYLNDNFLPVDDKDEGIDSDMKELELLLEEENISDDEDGSDEEIETPDDWINVKNF